MRFKAAIDGGSRGNPGPAAWGVVILDEDGSCIEGHAGVLGRATNNVAEYHGLLQALELARLRGASDVEIFADSQLIVRQIRGEYRVRHSDLKPLCAEARRTIDTFDRFQILHVPRERNKEADRMVNQALNRLEADPDGPQVRIHEVRGQSS